MKSVDAIILAGGKASRLASVVSDLPKPLAPVRGRPFVEYILDQLFEWPRIGKVILSVGHLAEKFDDWSKLNRLLPIKLVVENEPLGTGGGIRLAAAETRSDSILILNGDTLVQHNINDLLHAHEAASQYDVTILLVHVSDSGRFGQVRTKENQVVAFIEKGTESGPGWINAGTYVVRKELISRIPVGKCSFESEVLPRLVKEGKVGAWKVSAPFLDMGLPESYAAAEAFVAGLKRPCQLTKE